MSRWLFLALLVAGTALSAKETPYISPIPPLFELQARLAGQYNIDSTVRNIYGDWTPVYQLEASSGTWHNLYGWFNVGLSNKSGHTPLFNTKTTYLLVPLALGFKYAFWVKNDFFYYIGFGANLSYLHTNDRSDYVPRSNAKWGGGCTAKSGIRFTPSQKRKCFWEFFVDYSYLPFNFSSEPTLERPSVDMGGLIIGIGFGGPALR